MARAAGTASVLLASLAAGCSDNGGGGGSDPETGAIDLYVVDVDLDGLDAVPLNVPIQMEFSEFVLPDTIRHDTIQVRQGPNYGIQSPGEFKVSGNIVTFYPRLPSESDLSDGGLRAGQQYRVTIAGHPRVNHVMAYTGRPLTRTFEGSFKTAVSTSADLFTVDNYRDPPPPRVQFTNPPDVLPESPWDQVGGAVGVAPKQIAIQVVMNRVPLLPSTVSSTNVTLTMLSRKGNDFIPPRPVEPDPKSPNKGIWVDQSFDGTTLYFKPRYPLPSEARFVLRIENRVTDLTGDHDVADNAARAALRADVEEASAKPPVDRTPEEQALINFAADHPEEFDPRTFLIFQTGTKPIEDLVPPFELNFDGTDKDHLGNEGLDLNASTASFNDAVPGAVSAQFTAAGGNGTLGDFAPTSNTSLSTDNAAIAPNGVFNYRQIKIPSTVTVTITGLNPATLYSLKPVLLDGIVDVSGAPGVIHDASPTQSSHNPSKDGGAGGPGSGKGGNSTTQTQLWGTVGNPGQDGPHNGGKGGLGGVSGTLNTQTQYANGGGGGGGGHQYPGTAGAAATNGNTSYQSWNGAGGAGGAAGGILPNSTNTNSGKDFYILGVGAGGGGAGGNGIYSTVARAATGGGGGGAVLIQSAADIKLSATTRILSRGGAGGPATGQYSNAGPAGAGGGGAGGSIALYANGNLTVTGATMDTSGGTGGASNANGWPGRGGNGGGGFIQLEDADKVITGITSATMTPDYYTDKFDPTGSASDAPSVFTSTWFNVGVFEPILQEFQASHFTDQNYLGCTIRYEIQMAIEDTAGGNFGHPDTSTLNNTTGSDDTSVASLWATFKDPTFGIQDVRPQLNGHSYQFLRIRLTFTLKDGQKRSDPLPYVDRLRIPFRY
jgi:hypothetical protein